MIRAFASGGGGSRNTKGLNTQSRGRTTTSRNPDLNYWIKYFSNSNKGLFNQKEIKEMAQQAYDLQRNYGLSRKDLLSDRYYA